MEDNLLSVSHNNNKADYKKRYILEYRQINKWKSYGIKTQVKTKVIIIRSILKMIVKYGWNVEANVQKPFSSKGNWNFISKLR